MASPTPRRKLPNKPHCKEPTPRGRGIREYEVDGREQYLYAYLFAYCGCDALPRPTTLNRFYGDRAADMLGEKDQRVFDTEDGKLERIDKIREKHAIATKK